MARAPRKSPSRPAAKKSPKTRQVGAARPAATAQARRIERIVAEALRDEAFAAALLAALSAGTPADVQRASAAQPSSAKDAAAEAAEDASPDASGDANTDDLETAALESASDDSAAENDDSNDDPGGEGQMPGNLTLVIRPRILKGFTLRIGAVNWNRND